MHELSLCRNLMSQALEIAKKHQAHGIKTINITMGPLCGIDADHLEETFMYACSGTMADKAKLIIKKLPVKIKCLDCHTESEATIDQLICRQCGSLSAQLMSGDEIMLSDVELIT